MNRKLLTIALAVLVLILSASAVTALVTPPPGIKDPTFAKIWGAIMDLQKQITTLKTRVDNIPAGANIVTVKGEIYTNQGDVYPPDEFSVDQCQILVTPYYVACSGSREVLAQVSSWAQPLPSEDPPHWSVATSGVCYNVDDNSRSSEHIVSHSSYLLVCES